MLNFLIRSATSQLSSYPIVLTRLGGQLHTTWIRMKITCEQILGWTQYCILCLERSVNLRRAGDNEMSQLMVTLYNTSWCYGMTNYFPQRENASAKVRGHIVTNKATPWNILLVAMAGGAGMSLIKFTAQFKSRTRGVSTVQDTS